MRIFGEGFIDWLMTKTNPSGVLFGLAKGGGVVLLPGRGFGALNPSVRVSLANRNEPDYVRIGATLQRLLEEYHQRWLQETGQA